MGRHFLSPFLFFVDIVLNRFVPPLIDRLLDSDPLSPAESVRPFMSLDEFKAAVARDVESLLNTRGAIPKNSFNKHLNVCGSVWTFGLVDFADKSMSNLEDRESISRSIERAITSQESRLSNVRVTLESSERKSDRLRFNIQALLLAHPLQEIVSFDAELQTNTQNYAVHNVRRGV
jgi:type VI secretion system protein ImpF